MSDAYRSDICVSALHIGVCVSLSVCVRICQHVLRIKKSVHLSDAGPGEGHDDGHYIDRELELQELRDAIVDISSPHHCLDNAAEVVISQDDVGRLFSHICPSNTLAEIETE